MDKKNFTFEMDNNPYIDIYAYDRYTPLNWAVKFYVRVNGNRYWIKFRNIDKYAKLYDDGFNIIDPWFMVLGYYKLSYEYSGKVREDLENDLRNEFYTRHLQKLSSIEGYLSELLEEYSW